MSAHTVYGWPAEAHPSFVHDVGHDVGKTRGDRERELIDALEHKDVLLREVHHRVKNNLQVVSSLINMQLRALGEGSSRDALVGCQTRVQAMALIHEKLYESADCAGVPFGEYVRSLCASVFHATGVSPEGVSLVLAVQDVELAMDSAVPCGLILNELITNALKHAFPDGRAGIVRVELRQMESGALRLGVSDDGIGLPQGFDVRRPTSLGLRLLSLLARQLGATLEVESGGGTCVRLRVPARG